MPLKSIALAAALVGAGGAWAQAALQPAPTPHFAIRGFTVTGDNPLGDGETARVLAPFLRADATIETLQKATAALETALREKGYGLHRVALPPQEVGEMVKLEIVKFSIGKVAIEGRTIYDEGNVRRTLPELREGGTPNFQALAVQTAIANENANKQIQVGLRESEEPDKIDATITVKEQKPWNIGVGLSNAGTAESGRDRLTVTASHSNVFDLDHQFVGAYTTSIQHTQDVKQLGLSYKVPLYEYGTVLGASFTQSDVVGNFGAFTSTGAGRTAGVSATRYMPPEGGRRSYVTVAFDDKVFDATQINGLSVGVDRRSRPFTLSYTARTESDAYVWGWDADLAINTASGTHDDLASYQQEDPRIDTVHWKAVRGSYSFTAPVAQTWLWSARGQYQLSPDALISGEQFGLGGLGSVRGTSIDRPVTGDSGVSVNLELMTPEWVKGLRLLGFIDAGWVRNNEGNGSRLNDPAKPATDRLASAGVGLRFASDPWAFSLDYGHLLNSSRVPLSANSSSPQKGDDRFYVNMQVRF